MKKLDKDIETVANFVATSFYTRYQKFYNAKKARGINTYTYTEKDFFNTLYSLFICDNLSVDRYKSCSPKEKCLYIMCTNWLSYTMPAKDIAKSFLELCVELEKTLYSDNFSKDEKRLISNTLD